jgi:hypothetical protein
METIPNSEIPNLPEQFDDKKKAFFRHLGFSVREALKLHKEAGLWAKKEGKRNWGNVSEHCLVEVARADVLADKLNLPEDIKRDLIIAAALHDFFKKGEQKIVSAEGLTWASFEKASQESTRQMRETGFNERTIHLANSVGHGSLLETENVLNKDSLSPEDIAYLVLHYVDDYSIGSNWANPNELSSDGNQINDLDRRMNKNEANERYAQLNQKGKKYFNGATTFGMQRRIGHLIEERLATLIAERTGQVIDVKNLPQLVDAAIKTKIEEF